MNFLNYLKSKIILILVAVIGFLASWVKLKSYQNSRLEGKIDKLEEDIQIQHSNNRIKEFQALNNERKEGTSEKINVDARLDSDTTYRV